MAEAPDVKRGVFRRAGISNVIISGVVALLSYFSFTLIASRFGGSSGSDAYFFVFSLTTIASGLITSLFGVVVVPIFVEIKVRQGLAKAGEFAGSILSICMLVTVPVALASYIWHEQFFGAVSKYSPSQIQLTRFVLIYFAPIFLVTVLAEYFRILVLAMGRYTLAAVGAVFQPAMLIAFIFIYSGQLGEEAMSLSLLTGRLAVLVFMLLVVYRVEGLKIPLRLKPSASVARFVRVSTPYWSANAVSNFATFYFDYMATGLGTGVLSSISYAQRIFTLPVFVVVNPIMDIARTRFAEARATGDLASFAQQHNKLMQFVIYFTVPVAILFLFFSQEIISSMFERGAFGKDNVAISVACLQVFAFSVPLSSLFILNGRAVETFQKLAWPSLFGTIGQLLSIILTFALVDQVGYLGIPLSKVLIDLLYFLPFGFIAIRIFCPQTSFDQIARVAVLAIVASLLPILVYFVAGISGRVAAYFPSLLALGSLIVVFAAIYSLTILALDRRISVTGFFRKA
jgi:putative peptidoglycan lipid II flippase